MNLLYVIAGGAAVIGAIINYLMHDRARSEFIQNGTMIIGFCLLGVGMFLLYLGLK